MLLVVFSCEGHELFDEIVDRRTFNEEDARDLIRSILEPLAYLHAQGIAHRDLKPENIMFVNENDIKHIKLLDFGFAKTIDVAHPEISAVGTLGYKAPEIFNNEPFNTACDMWALGVISYILLCGFPPFFSKDDYADLVHNAPFWYFFNDETESLVNHIKKGDVPYLDKYWKNLSPQAKSFVQSLLVVDPQARTTAADALRHPWMSWKPLLKNASALDWSLNASSAVQRLRGGKRPSSPFLHASTSSLDATKTRIEKHILADVSYNTLAFSADWARTDVDENEDFEEVKYRLLNSHETQEAQLEMLSALDRPLLKEYLQQRRGSLGSRNNARPARQTHQRKASI